MDKVRRAAAQEVAKLARRAVARGTDKSAGVDHAAELKPGWVRSGADFHPPIKPALLQEAVAYLDIAIDLCADPNLHYEQARVFEQLSDFDAAIRASEAAIALSSQWQQFAGPMIERCQAKKSGRHDPAGAVMRNISNLFEKVSARSPDGAARKQLDAVLASMTSAVISADDPPQRFENRPDSRSADFSNAKSSNASTAEQEDDAQHHLIEFAENFGWALVQKDFGAARAMLSEPLQQACTETQLQQAYAEMTGYMESGVEHVSAGDSTMEDWPAKQPGDRLWVYVGLIGEGEHEAVTVVVAGRDGALSISALEWGRP